MRHQTYTPYQAPLLLRNGHLNTLYAYWFCKVGSPLFVREEMETEDGDFIEVDRLKRGNKSVLLLLHGLEGSTSSSYIRRMATLAHQNGYDICAMNHRSCGGKMNRKPFLYHSGFTQDLNTLVQVLSRSYEGIYFAGYSLGGNILLKYLGDGIYPVPSAVRAAVAISTPVLLSSCAKAISGPSNYLYEMGFLRGLKSKMSLKADQYPGLIDKKRLKSIKSLIEFDEVVTAPLNGFESAAVYYEKCSSLPHLTQISIPTLLINALDDPMLREPCYPFELTNINANFHFLAPKHGGHVGFSDMKSEFYWIDHMVLSFLSAHRGVF